MTKTGIGTWSKIHMDNQTSDEEVNWREGQLAPTINNSARAMMSGTADYSRDLAGHHQGANVQDAPTRIVSVSTSDANSHTYSIELNSGIEAVGHIRSFLFYPDADNTHTVCYITLKNPHTSLTVTRRFKGFDGLDPAVANVKAGVPVVVYFDPLNDVFIFNYPSTLNSLKFTELTDTPSTYSGQYGKVLAVNNSETGTEFITVGSGGTSTFTQLTDTPTNYTGKLGNFLKVNDNENGVIFSNEIKIGMPHPSTYTNVAVGIESLEGTTVGGNTAVGYYSLKNNTTGRDNTAVGYYSLKNNTTGRDNTAVGCYALQSNKTKDQNTAVGCYALQSNTIGDGNTAVGHRALRSNETGYNSTALGYLAGAYQNYTNCTFLGYNTLTSGNNQVQLGNSSTTTYAYGSVQDRSDSRDKSDVRETTLGLSFINELRPVEFKWDYRSDYVERVKNPEYDPENNEDSDIPEYITQDLVKDGSKKRVRFHQGLIAQEVKAVCERLDVDFGGLQHHSKNGGDDVYSIGYSELIAPIISAIQDLSEQIEELKNRE